MDTGFQTAATMGMLPLAPAPGRAGTSQGGNPAMPGGDAAKAAWAAKEYESVFISQFIGSMFAGIKTDGITGGGQGEEMFRSMMVDQYAKGLTARGGFGLAANMQAELLKYQQARPEAAAQ